ncbi:hypothetical protein GOP56_20930 [Brevibacillus sp. 7WMA2]|uniref:hypothetical protein n=1 Tax=Brevibacillus sp. 7WMA2 TaxID=2683193 RepID=UPI0013A79F06|nr:hypothetical protein [Brevibacillus sp. 7WMA2]QIC07816.1 hypothetical protein GOP56_20930 [Brevibacillus sp. 7WMA2]WPS88883.1 hypothetical protein SMD22_08005 [Brevibacillus halotolerans]
MKKVLIVIGLVMAFTAPTAALADNGAKPIDYSSGTGLGSNDKEKDNNCTENSTEKDNHGTDQGRICDNGARPK